jgi:hypothetical protein
VKAINRKAQRGRMNHEVDHEIDSCREGKHDHDPKGVMLSESESETSASLWRKTDSSAPHRNDISDRNAVDAANFRKGGGF